MFRSESIFSKSCYFVEQTPADLLPLAFPSWLLCPGLPVIFPPYNRNFISYHKSNNTFFAYIGLCVQWYLVESIHFDELASFCLFIYLFFLLRPYNFETLVFVRSWYRCVTVEEYQVLYALRQAGDTISLIILTKYFDTWGIFCANRSQDLLAIMWLSAFYLFFLILSLNLTVMVI